MRILLKICGFRLQFAESAHNLWILLFCGFRLQLPILQQLNTYTIICLWFPQTGLDSTHYGAILGNTVFKLFVRGIRNSREKIAMLRIPRQI